MNSFKRGSWAAPTSMLLALGVLLSGLLPQAALAETKVTYLYNDANGTALAAADQHGELLWRRAYAPFGEETEVSGDTVEAALEPRGYSGHTLDRNTGLIYMGARYYNPRLGLFYSHDPVAVDAADPITFNRYIYANQNPYAYVDPDGKLPILAVIWVAGAVLTAVDTYTTYKVDGAKAAATRLALDGALTLVGGVVGKGAVAIGKQLFKKSEPLRLPAPPVKESPPPASTSPQGTGTRFIGDADGNIVDTYATPPGRWIQPDRSATDVLQKTPHPGLDPFTSRTHTHPSLVNANPNNPAQSSVSLGEPRAVSHDEALNIAEGRAKRSTPRGR